LQREALFSPCGAYRYRLSRDWNGTGTRLAVVMLNPSTADAARDDPTIRRCITFAVREGHCGVEILNLFAFSATEPALLKSAADPVGPDNDRHLEALFARHPRILAAWGAHGDFGGRAKAVLQMAERRGVSLTCLGYTAAGHPRHPLYVRADSVFLPFAGRADL